MYKSLMAAALAAVVLTSSCSSESETARAARLLYEQAQAQNLAERPDSALVLLDSLSKVYPAETQWQRAAMKLRPTVIINNTEKQITAIDDSIAMCEQRYNELLPKMKRISDARLVEPFYLDKASYNADFLKSTGVQPRVSEIGQFYFISSAAPNGIKHTGFTLSAADGSSVSVGPVPYDGEMNYRINGSEVVTYSPDMSAAAGEFAKTHAGCPVTLILTGGNPKQIKLSARDVEGIANCYEFSQSIVTARQLAFEKERLNRQLEIARSQADRLAE